MAGAGALFWASGGVFGLLSLLLPDSVVAHDEVLLAIFSAHPFSPDARVELTIVEGAVMFDRARDLSLRRPVTAGGGR